MKISFIRRSMNKLREYVENEVLKKSVVTRNINGHIMKISTRDKGIGIALRRMQPGDQDREPAFMEIIEQEVKPGMCVYDIGANIGHVTVNLARLVGETGQVFAIEPSPANILLLRENVSLNKYDRIVKVFEGAITNYSGDASFFMANESNLGALQKTPYVTGKISTKVETLDNFAIKNVEPDFIKMDVEGAEIEVLDGFYQTALETNKDVKILIEVHPTYYSEERSFEKQLLRYFELGFYTKYLISAGVDSPDFFVENGYQPIKSYKIGKLSRGIYEDVTNNHVVQSICSRHRQYIPNLQCFHEKIVRAIMLEKVKR